MEKYLENKTPSSKPLERTLNVYGKSKSGDVFPVAIHVSEGSGHKASAWSSGAKSKKKKPKHNSAGPLPTLIPQPKQLTGSKRALGLAREAMIRATSDNSHTKRKKQQLLKSNGVPVRCKDDTTLYRASRRSVDFSSTSLSSSLSPSSSSSSPQDDILFTAVFDSPAVVHPSLTIEFPSFNEDALYGLLSDAEDSDDSTTWTEKKVITTDPSVKIVDISPSFSLLFGFSSADLLNSSLSLIIPNLDLHTLSWRPTEKGSHIYMADQRCTCTHQDGTHFMVELVLVNQGTIFECTVSRVTSDCDVNPFASFPQVVHNMTILYKLAEGGFSQIWKAQSEKGEDIVVKVGW